MSQYAYQTTVTAEKTQAEITRLLMGRGADRIMTSLEPGRFCIAFQYVGAVFKLSLPLPDPAQKKITHTPLGKKRSQDVASQEYQKEVNRSWRAFGMVIKAKLVAVEEGISTMEQEFFGNVLMAGGQTVAERYTANLPALNSQSELKAIGYSPEVVS